MAARRGYSFGLTGQITPAARGTVAGRNGRQLPQQFGQWESESTNSMEVETQRLADRQHVAASSTGRNGCCPSLADLLSQDP